MFVKQTDLSLPLCVVVVGFLSCGGYQLCLCLEAELISCPMCVKPDSDVVLIKDLKVFCACSLHM